MLTRRLLPFLLVLACPLLSAQTIRIAAYNVEGLGTRPKDYGLLAKVIDRFDVVAAEDVTNADGLEKVLSLLAGGWEAAISESDRQPSRFKEYFGFFYNDRVELYKLLGAYPGIGLFSRPPFGANFQVKGSRFSFNLVACHIDSETSPGQRAAEINRLGEVYRYFENLTGNRGITIMAGDFGEERIPSFRALTDPLQVVPAKATAIGRGGLDRDYDHIFVSPGLRPRIQKADVLYWTRDLAATRSRVSTHFPVYLVLRAGR